MRRSLSWITGISMILGLIAGAVHNSRVLNDLLIRAQITGKTGALDVWHYLFSHSRSSWVDVRFKDGKRLIGNPILYSLKEINKKQLYLAGAVWYLPNNNGQLLREEVNGPGVLLPNLGRLVN